MNSRKIETCLMKRSSKCLKGFFYIEGKLKLRCLTILWKSRWVGGSLNLEIRRGWGLKQCFRNPGGRGGGGVKNRAFRHGGVDFFWNNPLPVSSNPLKGPFLFLIMQQWEYKNRRLFTSYQFKLLASCAVNGEVIIKHDQIGKFRPANP